MIFVFPSNRYNYGDHIT